MTQTVKIEGFGPVNFPDSMTAQQIEQAIERDVMPKLRADKQAALDAGKRTAFEESKDAPVGVDLGVTRFDIPREGLRKFAKYGVSPGAVLLDKISSPDVGRGFKDVGQGAVQLYKRLTGAPDANEYGTKLSEELRDYETGRGGEEAGFDWGRLGGNVGGTSFLGLLRAPAAAGPLLKYGLTAVQGGAGGALNVVDESKGDFAGQKTMQTAIGAAVAPAAQFGLEKAGSFIANKGRQIGDFIGTTLRRVRGESANPNAVIKADGTLTDAGKAAAEKLGVDWSQVGDDAKAALRKLADDATRQGRALTPEQALRATLIKEVTGEEATLGQTTRDFAQQQTEHDLKKINEVGAPIRARFAKQNRGLIQQVKQMQEKAGGTGVDEYEVGRRVATSVKAADDEARSAVSQLYKEIDQQYGGSFKIKPQTLLDKLDEVSDNAEGDAIVASVQRKLKRFGLLNDSGAIKRGASLNASQAEELRKFVGSQLTGDTPNKKRMISALVDALDDDVKISAGDDVYEVARKVAKTRFEDLRIPAVRDIVSGDVHPEEIFDKYVRRGGIDDLTALKNFMSRKTTKPPAGGSEFDPPEVVDPHKLGAAWDELRSQTLGHIFEKSTRQAAKNELDDVIFSGAEFKKALYGQGGIGRRKLEILFSKEELAQLDKVANVAEWRIPMADVLNTSNTNSAWWNMLDRVLSYLPGKTGMVARGAGRAAKVGADQLAAEAAARDAMTPASTLARKAEEEAAERTRETVRDVTGKVRAPTFFSMGTERRRQ